MGGKISFLPSVFSFVWLPKFLHCLGIRRKDSDRPINDCHGNCSSHESKQCLKCDVEELKKLVFHLSEQIQQLQTSCVNEKEKNKVKKTAVAAQTDQCGELLTFAQVVSAPPVKQPNKIPAPFTATVPHKNKNEGQSGRERKGTERFGTNDVITRNTHHGDPMTKRTLNDVKIETSHDDRKGSTEHMTNNRRMNKNAKSSMPKVVMMNDSICNSVSGKRLGRAYGFDAVQRKTYTIDEVLPTLEKELQNQDSPVDGIIIHTGVNDLKQKDPASVHGKFSATVKSLLKRRPSAKIVVSCVAPTRHAELDKKREVLNAMLVTEFKSEKNVVLVFHDNLSYNSLSDGLHPNQRGSSVIARNIGRQVRDLFWERPRKFVHMSHYNRGFLPPPPPPPPPRHFSQRLREPPFGAFYPPPWDW